MPQEDPRAKRELDKLQRLVQQASDIVSDTLFLTGPIAPRFSTLDFADLVSSCLGQIADGDSFEVCFVEDSECMARVDLGLAKRMVLSLLNFARNYHAGDFAPVVTLSKTGSCLRFEVCLVPPAHGAARAGDLFDPLTPYLPGGGGLALASARRMAEAQ